MPWRVAGKKVAPPPPVIDACYTAVVDSLRMRTPLVLGGRSAGARSACRIGRQVGARGVLALSFPLHPPGSPEKSRLAELQGARVRTLVIQGERDPFGTPEEFPDDVELAVVPYADHAHEGARTLRGEPGRRPGRRARGDPGVGRARRRRESRRLTRCSSSVHHDRRGVPVLALMERPLGARAVQSSVGWDVMTENDSGHDASSSPPRSTPPRSTSPPSPSPIDSCASSATRCPSWTSSTPRRCG